MAPKLRIYESKGYRPVAVAGGIEGVWPSLQGLPASAVKCYLLVMVRDNIGFGSTDAADVVEGTGLSEGTVRRMLKVLKDGGLLSQV